jgi:predicted small secreted protein
MKEEVMLKRFVSALVGLGFVAMLAGCNTMEGVGQDMKAAGNGIENSARDHKSY